MEKFLEIGKEDGMWVIRLRPPRAIPDPAREHFRTACREFREGWRSLFKGGEKKGPTKVDIS